MSYCRRAEEREGGGGGGDDAATREQPAEVSGLNAAACPSCPRWTPPPPSPQRHDSKHFSKRTNSASGETPLVHKPAAKRPPAGLAENHHRDDGRAKVASPAAAARAQPAARWQRHAAAAQPDHKLAPFIFQSFKHDRKKKKRERAERTPPNTENSWPTFFILPAARACLRDAAAGQQWPPFGSREKYKTEKESSKSGAGAGPVGEGWRQPKARRGL